MSHECLRRCHVCPLTLNQSPEGMPEDVPADSLSDACPNRSGTDVLLHRTVRPDRLLAIFLGTGKQEIGRLVVRTLRTIPQSCAGFWIPGSWLSEDAHTGQGAQHRVSNLLARDAVGVCRPQPHHSCEAVSLCKVFGCRPSISPACLSLSRGSKRTVGLVPEVSYAYFDQSPWMFSNSV
jgi:hypothetical protein